MNATINVINYQHLNFTPKESDKAIMGTRVMWSSDAVMQPSLFGPAVVVTWYPGVKLELELGEQEVSMAVSMAAGKPTMRPVFVD